MWQKLNRIFTLIELAILVCVRGEYVTCHRVINAVVKPGKGGQKVLEGFDIRYTGMIEALTTEIMHEERFKGNKEVQQW
jgi:hypothetical protein